jgi:uncharacterized protein (DUF488 family)
MTAAGWYGGTNLARHSALPLPADPLNVQLKNKADWNEARSIDGADFYTVSYAGRTIEQFRDALIAAGVVTLVDIRYNPVSMYKPDFSKANLRRHLEDAGVRYIHFPELGIPRDIRSLAIDKPDRSDLWTWYDRYVAEPYVGHNLHHFLNFADHPVALMCVETDPTSCHRHRLGLALERLGLQGFDL